MFEPLPAAAVPRLVRASVLAVENGSSSRDNRVSEGAVSPRSVKTGVADVEKASSLSIVERNSRRKLGKRANDSSSSVRSAVAEATTSDWLMKLAIELAPGPGPEHDVGIGGELREHPVLAGEDGEDLVGLAQRRVGALDDLGQLLAAPRARRRGR